MLTVTVIRNKGDRPGPDITDSLLTEYGVMLERGRVALDTHEPQAGVPIQCLYQPTAKTGDIVKIVDAGYGPVWYGKITSIRHTAVPGGAVTELEVLRKL